MHSMCQYVVFPGATNTMHALVVRLDHSFKLQGRRNVVLIFYFLGVTYY